MTRTTFINLHKRKFTPAKQGDVGHDLVSNVNVTIWPFQTKTIPTGIHLALPNNMWAMIVARSSTTRRHLMVFQGIIDSGYRGELFVVMRNLSLIPRRIKRGERYAQTIFFPSIRPELFDVTETFRYDLRAFHAGTQRGATGFGSSGQ